MSKAHLTTFARWRPLTDAEEVEGAFDRSASLESNGLLSVSIQHREHKPWKSTAAFQATYEPADNNAAVFESMVADAIPKVMTMGASCNFFAYGHSGSGKTHTITGYDYEDDGQLGICLAAAKHLFAALDEYNSDHQSSEGDRLGVGFSLFELRKNVAYDLLNERKECHVRQGPDGKTHIRGPTEMLEDGKVRVRPIVKRAFWKFEALRDVLKDALGMRAVGSSSVHDLSSRTHAVLELEVVSGRLAEAREALDDRQSELVPVGKRATDVQIEEHFLSMIKDEAGHWIPNPERPRDNERVEKALAEKATFEEQVVAAERRITEMMESPECPPPLGGKLVFVDLAGSEYQQEKGNVAANLASQTPQEKQEGRQINTDLLALKEVIRAFASGQSRIPFRASPLTMVLRDHFLGSKGGSSAMVVTVSPAEAQYAATLNSLKYGSLVGAAAA